MARRNLMPPAKHTVTVYLDEHGNPLSEAIYEEQIVTGPDNSLTTLKRATNQPLITGEMFNPAMATGQDPVLLPALCAFCRAPHGASTRPMTNAKHLHLCRRCGTPCCPRHAVQSRYDRHWRCRSCNRNHRAKLLLRSIFFQRVDQ